MLSIAKGRHDGRICITSSYWLSSCCEPMNGAEELPGWGPAEALEERRLCAVLEYSGSFSFRSALKFEFSMCLTARQEEDHQVSFRILILIWTLNFFKACLLKLRYDRLGQNDWGGRGAFGFVWRISIRWWGKSCTTSRKRKQKLHLLFIVKAKYKYLC